MLQIQDGGLYSTLVPFKQNSHLPSLVPFSPPPLLSSPAQFTIYVFILRNAPSTPMVLYVYINNHFYRDRSPLAETAGGKRF